MPGHLHLLGVDPQHHKFAVTLADFHSRGFIQGEIHLLAAAFEQALLPPAEGTQGECGHPHSPAAQPPGEQ